MLSAKQNDTVVSKTWTETSDKNNILCNASLLLNNMQIYDDARYTLLLLLSPPLSDRFMSSSTTPMSSSRLLGSSKGKTSSLTLEKKKNSALIIKESKIRHSSCV